MNKRMMLNNKGFTLIELMAAIILLAVVMSVTTISVVGLINSSKENSYKLLVSEIKTGLENYYMECKNQAIMGNSGINCDKINENITIEDEDRYITIENLVTYGFLKSSEKESDNKVVKNPKTNENINDCKYIISLDDSSVNYKYVIEADNSNRDKCPRKDELNK